MKRLLAALIPVAFVGGSFWGSSTSTAPHQRNIQEVRDEGLVNGSRMQNGKTPAYDEHVADVCAHQHAVRMYREGQLRHSTNSELVGCLGGGKVIGENVGYTGSLNEAHEAKLRSSSHRRIIHGSWSRMGTGVVVDEYGGWWTAELFWRRA